MEDQEHVPGRHLGEVRAPDGAVCTVCGEGIAPAHWARHGEKGWRHDVCPVDIAQAD